MRTLSLDNSVVNHRSVRTAPAVQSAILSNRKKLKVRQVRFSMLQFVGFLGLLGGFLVVSFYLGYYTGQKSGFDSALAASVDSLARFDVSSDREEQVVDAKALASRVYEKLNQEPGIDEESAIGDGPSEAKAVADFSEVGDLDIVSETAPESFSDFKEKDLSAADADTKVEEALKIAKPKVDILEPKSKNANLPEGVEVLGETGRSDVHAKMAALSDIGSGATLGERKLKDAKKKESNIKIKATIKDESAVDKHLPYAKSKPIEKPVAKVDPPVAPVSSKAQNTQPGSSTFRNYVLRSLGAGWYAQVAAPRELGDAGQIVNMLRSSGFREAAIEEASVGGQKYYRVIVGPEGNRQRAQILVSQLKRESYLKGDPFLRLIK